MKLPKYISCHCPLNHIFHTTTDALCKLCYEYIRVFVKQIPTLAKGTTAFVSVSNTCLTARLEIAVFYVPLPTIENVEICWKRRKIGHYRAVQFSGREAVSISPKQSVVGSTPTGLTYKNRSSFQSAFAARSARLAEKSFFAFIFCPPQSSVSSANGFTPSKCACMYSSSAAVAAVQPFSVARWR